MNALVKIDPTNLDYGFDDYISRYAGSFYEGPQAHYSKGNWDVGGEINPTDQFLVDLSSLTETWEIWINKQVKRIVADARGRLPERDELGHNDPELWETGPDGFTKKDPRQEVH